MNFDQLVAAAEAEVATTVRELPRKIRDEAARLPVFFERLPDDADIETGIDPDTLGLFDEGCEGAPMPRIRLWLENIADFAAEEDADFLDEVRITYLHELGHFLGWDEDDLDDRGLG